MCKCSNGCIHANCALCVRIYYKYFGVLAQCGCNRKGMNKFTQQNDRMEEEHYNRKNHYINE